ncbi:MAG: hypothetical protein R2828_05495 [Saprospiraceae bacterium]
MKTSMKSKMDNIIFFFGILILFLINSPMVYAQDKKISKPNAPEPGKIFDESRNDFLLTTIPNSSQADINHWNKVVNKMQGVEGSDPVSSFINGPPAERFGSKYNNWYPIDRKKHTCCGNLHGFQNFDGPGDEMDWNFYIAPRDEFLYLINDVIKFRDSDDEWHKNKVNGGYLLEGEITPDQTLYDNLFFPKRGKVKVQRNITVESIITTPELSFVQQRNEICIYGAWVRERIHNNRPEIHPCEMIWWQQGNNHYIMFIQDDSNRFDDESDFDLDNFLVPSSWKPWAKPPLTAQFKIAFEVKPSDQRLPKEMNIHEFYNRFVVTDKDADARADSDNGTSHALVINNKRLLVVNEKQNKDNDLGVKFVDISKRADGTIQGYVQITTKIGGPSISGDEGYHVLHVLKKNF